MSPRKALSPKEISNRAQLFLKILVERYIREGQPVGSRTLAKDVGMDLSPATIRNVMADLEEMGLVHSPHTSAGRGFDAIEILIVLAKVGSMGPGAHNFSNIVQAPQVPGFIKIENLLAAVGRQICRHGDL